MLNGYCSLDRIRTQLEFDLLVAEAKKDSHGVFVPTHVIRKKTDTEAKVCGYFSISPANVAFVFAWLSTMEIQPRESFHLINNVENFVALTGNQLICLPVPKSSPFYPLMESMGYTNNGDYTFFTKQV